VDEKQIYYTCWCPVTDSECPKTTRQLCSMPTLSDCREYCEHHLRTSSYHYIEDSARLEALVEGMLWEQKDWDPAWGEMGESLEARDEGRPGPYEKGSGDKGQGKGKGHCKGFGKGARGKGRQGGGDVGQLIGAVGQLTSALAASQPMAHFGLQQPGPSSSLGSMDVSTLARQTPAVSRATVAQLCENLGRAESALQAASRVATGAAQSFSMECANIQSCKQELDRVLRQMP
jgi:hypothetical protein